MSEYSLSDDKIIFIISLPRSGSTLLQRILTTHDEFFSCSETWFLLPQIYTMRKTGTFAEYGYDSLSNAIDDFTEQLPNKRETYLEEIKLHYLRLLNKIDSERIFIDKTPRNALILPELLDAFPNSKFIFLWRNPVSIISSMIKTFDHGRWNMYKYSIDLYDGLENMLKATKSNKGNIYHMNYENLVSNPDDELSETFKFLGSDFNKSNLDNLHSTLFDGRMGDPTGIHEYKGLSSQSVNKLDTAINNYLRKAWVKKYISYIGKSNLELMNYKQEQLTSQIGNTKNQVKNIPSDILYYIFGKVDSVFDLNQLKKKLARYKGKVLPRRHC